MKNITIEIGKDGVAKVIDACGFGTNCGEITANLEKRMGKVDESSRKATENFYLPVNDINITQSGE